MAEIDNLTQGILIVTLLITFYGISFYSYLKGKIYISLFFIIFIGLCLRLFCSLDPMLHKWDERYHALVARNIIDQPLEPKLYKEPLIEYNYKNWTANEIWLHKQPLPLWTMALSMKILGVSEFNLRLPSVLLSTLSIFLTFLIAFKLFKSERVGLIAAFLHSINGLIIELSSGRVTTDHIDTFFLFFVELSILFILLNFKNNKKLYLMLAGIACGLAILTKWLPALIIFPLYLVLNFKRKSNPQVLTDLVFLVLATLIIALPWQIYAHSNFPMEYAWEQLFNQMHFTEALEGHGQAWWFFLDRIRINVNELIYIILIWFAYYTYKNTVQKRENLFLLSYILIPFLVFSIAQTKMQGYLLFTFPGYFIITGLFIENLLFGKSTENLKSGKFKLSAIIVIAILILAVRYGLERVKPFHQNTNAILAKNELMNTEFPAKSVLFNMPCPIETMYYTDCTAYPNIPDQDLISKLHDENYRLYISDDGNLSNEIMQDIRIKKINLPATLTFCE